MHLSHLIAWVTGEFLVEGLCRVGCRCESSLGAYLGGELTSIGHLIDRCGFYSWPPQPDESLLPHDCACCVIFFRRNEIHIGVAIHPCPRIRFRNDQRVRFFNLLLAQFGQWLGTGWSIPHDPESSLAIGVQKLFAITISS